MIRTFVVDDEPAALERYAAYVAEYGPPFSVEARCGCAREALEAAAARTPDLILTDIRMPGEDGLALLQRLRESGWIGAAVVISGHDDFEYARKAIRLGILEYLLKPVFREDMRELLDRLSRRVVEGKLWLAPHRVSGDPLPSPAQAQRWLPEQVRRALDFVEVRYDSHFTIEEAARASCVSPAWLSTSFKRSMGFSIMEYARRRRTDKARELLAETDTPIKEIAERLAFPDLPTFAKLFRKLVGVSPGAYRKSLHSEGSAADPKAGGG